MGDKIENDDIRISDIKSELQILKKQNQELSEKFDKLSQIQEEDKDDNGYWPYFIGIIFGIFIVKFI